MKENKSALKNNKSALKDNKSAFAENIIQAPEKNILQHDHDIFQICPGWATHLCTFALWQHSSIGISFKSITK